MLIIVGGKKGFIIASGKRVFIIVSGKRVFDTGGKRGFVPGRQQSLFNLRWQKAAKIAFYQMRQKFGRKKNCSPYIVFP